MYAEAAQTNEPIVKIIDHDLKKNYERDGYAIVRNVIDPDLAMEIENHIKWLSGKHPNTRPEAFHHDMLIHDPFIHHLLHQEKILDKVQEVIGTDVITHMSGNKAEVQDYMASTWIAAKPPQFYVTQM